MVKGDCMRLFWMLGLVALAGCGNGGGAATCRFNSDCPAGRYCASGGSCRADCATDAECVSTLGSGSVCTSFGMCASGPDGGSPMLDSGLASDAGHDAAPSIDAATDATDAGIDGGQDGAIDAAPDANLPVGYSSVSLGDTTSLVVPLSSSVVVPYASELHDDLGEFDTTTSTFTATHAGVYRVCASLISPGGVGTLELDVFVDGTRERALGRGVGLAHGCAPVRVGVASTMDVRVQWDRAGTISPNVSWNWLTIDEEDRVGTSVAVSDMAGFTAAPATFTRVPYAAATHDSAGSWDATMSRFTASHPGDFEICASAATDDPSVGFELDLFIDGARAHAIAAGTGTAGGCRVVRLAGTHTFEVWAYQGSSSAQHFSPGTLWNWLAVQELPAGGTAIAAGDSASFASPHATFVRVPYRAESYDDGNEFDTTTSTWSVARAGDYLICASLFGAANFELDVFVDGTRERGFAFGPLIVGTGCRVLRVTPGQVVDIQTHQPGAAVTVSPNSLWNWLVIHALR